MSENKKFPKVQITPQKPWSPCKGNGCTCGGTPITKEELMRILSKKIAEKAEAE